MMTLTLYIINSTLLKMSQTTVFIALQTLLWFAMKELLIEPNMEPKVTEIIIFAQNEI